MEQYPNSSSKEGVIQETNKESYVYFLCLINWQNPLKQWELNELKNYLKSLDKSSQIGDWLKIDLGWEKEFGNKISTSELGFYHSRLIFRFELKELPKNITEVRIIKENLEDKIEEFFGDESEGIIKEIKDKDAKSPYLFTYPIFELIDTAKFWSPMEKKTLFLTNNMFFYKIG